MTRYLFWCAALLMTVGCSIPVDTDPTDTKDESVGVAHEALGVEPPKGLNGKTGDCTHPFRAALKTYASQALHAGLGKLVNVSLPTNCREDLIDNFIGCALRPDQSLFDVASQKAYTGHWGLAPSWYSSPLSSTTLRRYVTACMMQRLNVDGSVVPILLEGAPGPINYVPAYQSEMTFVESIAWGDIFTPPLGYTGTMISVCYNEDLYNECRKDGWNAPDWLKMRICDSSPSCGLTVVGKCSDVCTTGANGYPICTSVVTGTDTATVQVRLQNPVQCVE